MSVFIYALIDPRNKEIRYIGNTGNLEQRFACHLREKRNTSKCFWVSELLACGLQPEIEVLEITDYTRDSYLSAEAKWIHYGLKQGWQLFNCKIPIYRQSAPNML